MNDQIAKAKEMFDLGKSLVDIAAALGISPGTVRSWKSRYKWSGNTATQHARNATKAQRYSGHKKVQQRLEEATAVLAEPLTDRQRLFCEIYAGNRNATVAYIKAYDVPYANANTAGPRLLQHPLCRAYIDELLKIKRQMIRLEADDIVERYMRIAFADLTDYVDFGVVMEPVIIDGRPLMSKELDPNTGEPIPIVQAVNAMQFKSSQEVDGSLISEISTSKQGAKIKLHDQLKAMEWLDRYFEFNPADRHRREYDNKRLALEERAVKLQEEKARTDAGNDGTLFDLIGGLKQGEE